MMQTRSTWCLSERQEALDFSLLEVRQLLALARNAIACAERKGETQERYLAQIREKISGFAS